MLALYIVEVDLKGIFLRVAHKLRHLQCGPKVGLKASKAYVEGLKHSFT